MEIDPKQEYMLRSRLEHALHESIRVKDFYSSIWNEIIDYQKAGRIMYKSHWSYHHNCKLDSTETKLLVSLCKERGKNDGIYGAKISGKGEGGTVIIMTEKNKRHIIDDIIEDFRIITGLKAKCYDQSSDGTDTYKTLIQKIK